MTERVPRDIERSVSDDVVTQLRRPRWGHVRSQSLSASTPQSVPKQHLILFLAANPRGSDGLQLAEECAEIQRELKMTPHRDDFRFESRWAISIDELMRHLTELEPSVIHFSGHGGGSSGLLLHDEHGTPQLVPPHALAMIVNAASCNTRLVVLNACYSAAQAAVLRTTVDCVVGMDGAIGDSAARTFAVRFYSALGNRRSIANAVAHGIAALAARKLRDEVLPGFVTRDGIDADDIVFGAVDGSARTTSVEVRPVREDAQAPRPSDSSVSLELEVSEIVAHANSSSEFQPSVRRRNQRSMPPSAESNRRLVALADVDAVLEQARAEGWRELALLGPPRFRSRSHRVPHARTFHLSTPLRASISKLQSLTGLTSLDLSGNQLVDEDIQSLTKLTGLTSLALSDNEIGDDGTRRLASLTGLTSLKLEPQQDQRRGSALSYRTYRADLPCRERQPA